MQTVAAVSPTILGSQHPLQAPCSREDAALDQSSSPMLALCFAHSCLLKKKWCHRPTREKTLSQQHSYLFGVFLSLAITLETGLQNVFLSLLQVLKVCYLTVPKLYRYKHCKKRLFQLQAKINKKQCHKEAAIQSRKPTSLGSGNVCAGYSSGHREKRLGSALTESQSSERRMLWMDRVQVQSCKTTEKIRSGA